MSSREPTTQELAQLEREPDPDVASVVAHALQHGRELAHAEVSLAKAELKDELGRILTGAMAVALGVTFGAASLLVALIALAIQLGFGAWIISLTGLCAAAGGSVVAWWGQRRLVAPRLALTRGALRRGAERLKQVTDVKRNAR